MGVGDDGTVDGSPRVDVKAASGTVEAGVT
jgi:hypothetical protein